MNLHSKASDVSVKRLKVTFFNSVHKSMIFCNNPVHFVVYFPLKNMAALETLARHREK